MTRIEIEEMFAALARAEAAFELARDLGDAIALVLADAGQPELKARLMELREKNDADRSRRHEKLTAAAARLGDS
ncbi:hypothetical protein [Sphingomonas paucimobilis]|uniref:Uncharacterized protein n=1 Tax=Sphingomonas paucimobilis TaxID=13689 RepID=A0A7T3ADT7_SPHPI|nr:hypothetical protein [Sphingomonas paucimobilis]QPT09699.1 hypothetical protein I6G38_05435 [Sphingomonas paucimobilis]